MKKLLFTFFILLAPTLASAATLGKVQSNNIGLVGWWTFDGADQGTSVRDKSGNGFTMNPSGFVVGSSTKLGKIGQALNFDGVNDDVSTSGSSPASTGLITTEVTVSAWIKPSNLSNEHAIYTAGGEWIVETSATNLQWLDSGGPGGLSNGGSQGTAAILTKDEWQHVVFVGSSAGIKIYRNGVLGLNSGITLLGSGSSATHLIGSSGSRYFAGGIDDVRVYNRVLSQTEIVALYNSGSAGVARSSVGSTTPLSSGLVGYWTLDGSKTNWATGKTLDSSGRGSTGQLIFMSTSTSPLVGKIGQALNFNGSTQYINADAAMQSVGSSDMTLSVWEKTTSSAAMIAYSQSDDISGSVRFELDFNSQSTDAATVACRSDGHSFTSLDKATDGSTTYRDGQWHHFVGIMAATELRLYRDGVLVGTGPRTAPLCGGSITTTKQTIGAVAAGGYSIFFNGSVDDVRVYNRALSAQEIANLYNSSPKIAQSPGVGSSTPLGSGLIGYWTLDGSKTNWATGKTLDSSGQGNTATLINLSTSTSLTIGKVGQAMIFDGVSSYASTTGTNYFSTVDKNNSFFAWVYPTRSSANITSITQIGETADGNFATGLGISGGVLVRNEDGDQAPMPSSGLSVPLNQWSFVGYVHYQASNLTDFYVNDTTVTVSDTENRSISPNPVLIGAGAHNGVLGSFFSGKVDDVRLYGRTLTPAEVQKLYLMGR